VTPDGSGPPPHPPPERTLDRWARDLERRHLADLTFSEVRRALVALSSVYVERRDRIARGAALDGAGKRAAFALFYGPIHFAIVDHVVRRLGLARPGIRALADLGCGTGAAGAAWALASATPIAVSAHDLHPWAVAEAGRTFADLGVSGTARRGRIEVARIPAGPDRAVVLGWAVNELDRDASAALLARLVAAGGRGTRVLVVEPVARRPVPWWDGWADAFRAAGGRDDVWRFAADLPDLVARLDRAAGLDHRTLSARSLSFGARLPDGDAAP